MRTRIHWCFPSTSDEPVIVTIKAHQFSLCFHWAVLEFKTSFSPVSHHQSTSSIMTNLNFTTSFISNSTSHMVKRPAGSSEKTSFISIKRPSQFEICWRELQGLGYPHWLSSPRLSPYLTNLYQDSLYSFCSEWLEYLH